MKQITKLKFAVLRHSGHPEKPDHYDIVVETVFGNNPEETALSKFETDSELENPSLTATFERDVRRRYLEYEGPLDGNRGEVKRVDLGFYTPLNSHLSFQGSLLQGDFELIPNKEIRRLV